MNEIYLLYPSKNIPKIMFKFFGFHLAKLPYTFKIYNTIYNNIFNNPFYTNSFVEPNSFFLLISNIFINTTLIVKGMEDINTINNHMFIYNFNSIHNNIIFDIAKLNNLFIKLINSATLENSFNYVIKINNSLQHFNSNSPFHDFPFPHNPVFDSWMTLVVFYHFFDKF
jgi:hypothetical protein